MRQKQSLNERKEVSHHIHAARSGKKALNIRFTAGSHHIHGFTWFSNYYAKFL